MSRHVSIFLLSQRLGVEAYFLNFKKFKKSFHSTSKTKKIKFVSIKTLQIPQKSFKITE